MDIKIIGFSTTKVAVIEHLGPPELEHQSAQKLITWRIENHIPVNEKHRNYGIHYTNPHLTPPAENRVDLCISVDFTVPPNPQGVINKVIPACRCAVARHLGARKNILAAAYLHETWLPSSREKLGDFPVFFHYVNVGPKVQEDEMITDIYLPLK